MAQRVAPIWTDFDEKVRPEKTPIRTNGGLDSGDKYVGSRIRTDFQLQCVAEGSRKIWLFGWLCPNQK